MTVRTAHQKILQIEYGPPKTAIVPPVLVNTPHALTFLFVSVFWIVETSNPAAPVIMVPLIAALTASFGWY